MKAKAKDNADFLKSEPKDGSIKSKVFLLSLVLAIGLLLGAYSMKALIPINPLGQYINTRTCDFISMGGFQSAVCSDGTVWSVSPFQE